MATTRAWAAYLRSVCRVHSEIGVQPKATFNVETLLASDAAAAASRDSVSYTHLTLPTKA